MFPEKTTQFTRPFPGSLFTPTPTPTLTKKAIVGISWIVYLLIAYLLIDVSIRYLLPRVARYLGYLVKEFNKERRKE